MSKARKAAKKEKQAALDAKQVTAAKLLRIFLKIFAISILFSLAVGLAEAYLNWDVADKFWVRLSLIFLIILVAQPFIMSEFRPKK